MREIRAVLALVGLLAMGPPDAWAGEADPDAVSASRPPCDEADAWVRDFRDRVTAYSELARFASDRFGKPVACEGAVTTELDGVRFGDLVLTYGGGVTLEVGTMPPESSVTVLRSATGFADEEGVRAALRRHVEDVGLAIDWSAPDIDAEGPEEVHTFWDPEPGLNASASLIFSNDVLVAVRVGMAL